MKDKLEGVMRCSRYEHEQLKRKVKKLKEEKDELLEQLASCREYLLPLMENHNDYEELLALTVSRSIADIILMQTNSRRGKYDAEERCGKGLCNVP